MARVFKILTNQISFCCMISILFTYDINLFAQCLSGDCKNGFGVFQYSNGHKYEGNWINGMRSGKGKMDYGNGGYYDGMWANNKRNGFGKDTFAVGEMYIGEFVNDVRQGKGKYYWTNGNWVEGIYVNGRRNGPGKDHFISGQRFEGYFVDDKRNGKGKYYWPNGNVYEGLWVNDVAEDNNTSLFNTIKIGNKEWMDRNLDVSIFRNGDPITQVRTQEEWVQAGIDGKPAWCYYGNDLENDKKYGKLYNWYAVNDPRGLAPVGWHVSTMEEWDYLVNIYGGEKMAGLGLKKNSGWDDHNNGTNESSFTALPGGHRSSLGSFIMIGSSGYWWTSEETGNNVALSFDLRAYNGWVGRFGNLKGYGMSVRCVKD